MNASFFKLSTIQAFTHSFVKPLILIILFFPLILLFSSRVYADDNLIFNSILNRLLVKYPYVHYYDTVYTDKSRNQDGSLYTGGTPVNGFRLIDVRIYEPATGPGSGPPLRVLMEPVLFSSGLYPNVPLEQSTIGFQLARTWTNNAPQNRSFPFVLLYGGGGTSIQTLRLAESIAAAGFIAAVPTGYGVDVVACPDCGSAVSRTVLRDARNLITAAGNGQLGFNGSHVEKDSNGLAIVGCAGGSLGAAYCEQIASGATTTNSNSLPGETSADPRVRAVFAGDIYNQPSPDANPANFTATLGMFSSGQFENWFRDFALYSNASKRIFYDLTNADHGLSADLGSDMACDNMSELIRVFQTGVNTGVDDNNVYASNIIYMPPAYAHCSPAYLNGFESLPSGLGLPATLAALLPYTPLSGISYSSANDSFVTMTQYYAITFLWATLNKDPIAYALTTTPIFPGLLNNIYVNAVPGIQADNFNLQNKQIDFKPIPGTHYYKTTITTLPSGSIADPSLIPGAYSLGTSNFSFDAIPLITPAFNFPLQNGNIPSSNSIAVSPNGYLSLESNVSILDGGFAAPRLNRWFADHGAWNIALFGSALCNTNSCGAAGPGSAGQVWVSNTPRSLQITFYKIYSLEFPNIPAVSVQCTLFPDGSIRLVYDNSIPAPGVITGEFGLNGSVAVGISNGRLHQDSDGDYDPLIQPHIVSFSNIMNGQSTNNADAIYEIYTQGVPAARAN